MSHVYNNRSRGSMLTLYLINFWRHRFLFLPNERTNEKKLSFSLSLSLSDFQASVRTDFDDEDVRWWQSACKLFLPWCRWAWGRFLTNTKGRRLQKYLYTFKSHFIPLIGTRWEVYNFMFYSHYILYLNNMWFIINVLTTIIYYDYQRHCVLTHTFFCEGGTLRPPLSLHHWLCRV